MRARSLAMAAALALSPAAAFAVTIGPASDIAPGSTNDVADAPFFFESSFDNTDGAGTFEFIFTNSASGTAAVTVAEGTVLQQTLEFTDGVTIEWLNGGSSVFVDQDETTGFELSTLIDAGSSDTLRISFGDPIGAAGRANIDFSVAATTTPIPLPASLPLLIGALGGLGYISRRRKQAA